MATITQWTPFGVALNITATASTISRSSATTYTVKLAVSWASYWSGAQTNYGMTAASGGSTVTINTFGTKASSGSGTLTGTYSISGNGSATKTVSVVFKNFNTDNGDSATKTVTLSVTVPAWTSYTVSYNANGGSGAPSSQTKWKDQSLTLSTTKPTRTGYTFAGWATSSTGSVAYAAGASYTANASVTLYAKWTALTYTVSYNANGGSGAPSSQTKTYGVTLTLSSTKPTRTNYTFLGWGTSASATSATYSAGGSYTSNAAITLYAVWSLAYTKPRITSFSVARCNSSGTVSDSGTYALVKFTWATDYTVSSVVIKWKTASATSYSSSATVSSSGTGATVSQVVGAGGLSTETSYNIQVVVTDSNGSSNAVGTIQSVSYPIDIKSGGTGIAFGKAAETANLCECNYDFQTNGVITAGKYIDQATAPTGGIKVHDIRNVTPTPGMFGAMRMNMYFDQGPTSLWSSILHITGWNASNYASHELAFNSHNNITTYPGLYHRTGIGSTWTDWKQLIDSAGGTMNGTLTMANNVAIHATRTDGTDMEAFNPCSSANNVAVGHGLYTNKSGYLNLYSHDIIHYVSNIATPGSYRPYRRQGDSLTISLKTSGFVTNDGTDVFFTVPFSMPIVGSPTVTAASTSGFILRQAAYTHGSSSSTYVTPTSYTAYVKMFHGVIIKAVFSNTTNVVNNDSIGIHWEGTITFS